MDIPPHQITELTDAGFQDFLKKLPPADLDFINELSEFRWTYTGQNLITQNAPSDSVCIIEEGVVEVFVETQDAKASPMLTYLGRGDIIGELGVLNREVRSATVRASSDVYYRFISTEGFLKIMSLVPGFAMFIAGRLARRLAQTNSNMAFNSICMDLSGKLPGFDLASVFHTIIVSYVTGELKVVDEHKDRVGCFFFDQGRPVHARFRHLQGLEACRQVLTEKDLRGAFSFRRSNVPSQPADPGFELNIGMEDMMMDGMMLRDELSTLPAAWQELSGRATGLADSGTPIPTSSEFDAEAMHRVSTLCSNGKSRTLQELWVLSGLSLVRFARAARQLEACGRLQVDF